MRWLLLDEVTKIEKKVQASTRSHVPDSPASPELLLIEMMAQTGGLLLGAEKDFQDDFIFAKIDSAQFADSFSAGEKIEVEATSENLKPEGAWIDGKVRRANDESILASSRFLLMNAGRLVPDQANSITFHEAFMNHFDVRNKVR